MPFTQPPMSVFPCRHRAAQHRAASQRPGRLQLLLAGCCSSLLALGSQAQETQSQSPATTDGATEQTASTADKRPWYQVELLIFTQPGYNQNAEAWDIDLRPSIKPQAIEPGSAEAKALGFRLNNKASDPIAISYGHLRNRGYEVLYHRTWTQPLTSRNQAQPLRIRAGEPLLLPQRTDAKQTQAAGLGQEDGPAAPAAITETAGTKSYVEPKSYAEPRRVYPLDGTLTLDIARYLHLRTELYYTQPDPRPQQASPYLTVEMSQARRMRGGELHYLDHPLFGLLIKLTAVEKPSSAN